MMWLSDFRYAAEGADYADMLLTYPLAWWLGIFGMIALGILILWLFPRWKRSGLKCVLSVLVIAVSAFQMNSLPELLFEDDEKIKYAGSDYGRSQSAFSEGGLVIGAGMEDLGKGERSMVGTMYGTKAKGVRYLEMTEGYCTRMALDEDNQVIGYEFVSLGKMTFFEPDTKTFPLLSLAKEVHKAGGLLPAVLNAANEEAVYAFLAKKIGFADIGYIVSDFVHSYENKADPTLDEIENASQTVRRKIRERLAQKEQ